jgi:hypothetical protein
MLFFFVKGYEENLRAIVNGAMFHEDYDEMVIVKKHRVFALRAPTHTILWEGIASYPIPSLLQANNARCTSDISPAAELLASPRSLE